MRTLFAAAGVALLTALTGACTPETATEAAGAADKGTTVEWAGLKSTTPGDWKEETPSSKLRQGQFKVPQRTPDPLWSIGGGFSPGDLTYPDYVGFVWWNTTDTAPDDGTGPGAYRHVFGGKKFRIGEMPEDPIPFFDPNNAVAGVSGS